MPELASSSRRVDRCGVNRCGVIFLCFYWTFRGRSNSNSWGASLSFCTFTAALTMCEGTSAPCGVFSRSGMVVFGIRIACWTKLGGVHKGEKEQRTCFAPSNPSKLEAPHWPRPEGSPHSAPLCVNHPRDTFLGPKSQPKRTNEKRWMPTTTRTLLEAIQDSTFRHPLCVFDGCIHLVQSFCQSESVRQRMGESWE